MIDSEAAISNVASSTTVPYCGTESPLLSMASDDVCSFSSMTKSDSVPFFTLAQ